MIRISFIYSRIIFALEITVLCGALSLFLNRLILWSSSFWFKINEIAKSFWCVSLIFKIQLRFWLKLHQCTIAFVHNARIFNVAERGGTRPNLHLRRTFVCLYLLSLTFIGLLLPSLTSIDLPLPSFYF